MVWKFIVLGIVAYVLGSYPNGLVIGKLFYHKDIRDYGSHNIGAANTVRTLGWIPGLTTWLFDVLKGAIPVWLAMFAGFTSWYPLIFGFIAVLGHSYSMFDHFQGGKGASTAAGMLLGINWVFFVIDAVLWWTLAFLTSAASISSMMSLIIITLISLFWHSAGLTFMFALTTLFILFKHRRNIKNIFTGKEELIPFGLVYWIRKKRKK